MITQFRDFDLESFNLLLLTPVIIGLVMLTRWVRKQPALPSVIGSLSLAIHAKVLLASPVAEIRRAMVCPGGHRLC
jgi:hypothetical protein